MKCVRPAVQYGAAGCENKQVELNIFAMEIPQFGYCFLPNQRSNDGSDVLHLFIEHYGVKRYVPTSYDVRRHEWNTRHNRLSISKGATSRGRILLEYDQSIARNKRLIESIIEKLSQTTKRFTADDVANAFVQAISGNSMLGVYANVQSEDSMFHGRTRAARGYETATRRFIAFNGGLDIDMSMITAEMMCNFQKALEKEKRTLNTISLYMRSLRLLYNKAINEGIIPSPQYDPFNDVYTGMPRKEVDDGKVRNKRNATPASQRAGNRRR